MKRLLYLFIALITIYLTIHCNSGSNSSESEGGSGTTDIYAGGYSTNAFNVQVPGYWKNGTWVALTPIDSAKNSYVSSIVVVTK